MKYHKTCYGSYTSNVKKPELEVATRYDGYETAFTQLVGDVDEKVFDNMDIMKITELRDTYLDMLSFCQPHNKTETVIIFSKDVSTGQAVEAVVVITEKTNAPLPPPVEETTHNKVHQVLKCAQIIRAELMTVRNKRHGHQHQKTLSRTTSTSLIRCTIYLHCPPKSTGMPCQLLKTSCTAFRVDG